MADGAATCVTGDPGRAGTGMAAATAIFQSLLPGDHVLASRVLYRGREPACKKC